MSGPFGPQDPHESALGEFRTDPYGAEFGRHFDPEYVAGMAAFGGDAASTYFGEDIELGSGVEGISITDQPGSGGSALDWFEAASGPIGGLIDNIFQAAQRQQSQTGTVDPALASLQQQLAAYQEAVAAGAPANPAFEQQAQEQVDIVIAQGESSPPSAWSNPAVLVVAGVAGAGALALMFAFLARLASPPRAMANRRHVPFAAY